MSFARSILPFFLLGVFSFATVLFGQDEDPREDTEKLINDVDALLKSLEADPDEVIAAPIEPAPDVVPPSKEEAEPFRADDALMPQALIQKPKQVDPVTTLSSTAGGLAVDPLDKLSIQQLQQRFEGMSLNELLKFVDTIDSVSSGGSGSTALPGTIQLLKPSAGDGAGAGEKSDTEDTGGTDHASAHLVKPLEVPLLSGDLSQGSSQAVSKEKERYVVLDGDRIDNDLAQKIQEAIMMTRLGHSGTNYPEPSQSVKKAENACNKVLYILKDPDHKQYRRDVLLALIHMFERAEMWVEAAKSTERFLEEFASDAKYPFANGEKAPTIAEVHLSLGHMYKRLGAFRMAVNKFYDALHSTLSVPKDAAFDFKHLANQAMIEIADTYLEMEDYDNAIKFFSRLLKVGGLQEHEKATVLFKHAYSHYQRAVTNERIDARRKQDPEQKDIRREYEPGTAPKADYARVKHDLRDYSFRYPESYYVPESYYLLVLTHDALNENAKALAQVQNLLRNSPYHPEQIQKAQDHPERKINQAEVARMIALWNFWKKKTGNYLANEFYEDGDYFRALQVYQALANIDDEPSWEIPLRYQVGLCHERLGNVGEARRIYEQLEDTPADQATSKNVKLVIDMAKQRANFVGWATSTDKLLLKASSRN
ncbi:MAG: hypothetical protein CMI31_11530 [Opitutae bacterium]|nr:hypothetical protein [Opitutae bacterium]|tara:strand:+ start:20 stop:1975 length:1956 start_codon:yes stop_codon:yes gene_type:complete